MVFLDHIPYDFLNWFTIKNYGFSEQPKYLFSFPAIQSDLHTGQRSKPASL